MTQQHDAPEGGASYTDDDLEREARKVHRERYPGQSWDSDSSARIVSYNQARKRLAAPTPPAPSGLADAAKVRAFLAALDATRAAQERGAWGDVMLAIRATENTARATLDATLSGQQGGAVPAGDLRPGLEDALRVLEALPSSVDETRVIHAHEDLTSGGRIVIIPASETTVTRPAAKHDWIAALRARLAEQPAPAGTGDADPATLYARRVTIPYINWRGEFGRREIAPIRLIWGSNEWHPKPQWLIEAWDIGKSEIRTFALDGIGVTVDADRVEGLRPGIEKALEIVEAERETVSVSSSAYQRLWSVRNALRDVLDGASIQETTP